MKQAQLIGSQKVFEQETTSNKKSIKEGAVSATWVTRNDLRTETKYTIGSQELDEIEERWVGNNQLIISNRMYWKTIENKYDVVECTRVYERVEPGHTQQSIKDQIVGSWRQIAMDGLKEFRENVEIKNPEAWNPEARLNFSHITIFNEIQMQHLDVNGESLKFEFAVISKEPKYTGTFFWENSLVTVNEEMRIVRCLKDDKLFVTCRKNEHYFVAVYEKC
ncbi:hypothetical protein CAEBREN_15328 [Caenorhabditis brenneri]|uniref:Uncharacterized protein n=1 Tax=Caenorhabditis brenneri TaxID=135651 RepID=G0MC07_CAEBE|nr:hypothetical protein CAEBREN_15328 [Caenorhabditis brenneri]